VARIPKGPKEKHPSRTRPTGAKTKAKSSVKSAPRTKPLLGQGEHGLPSKQQILDFMEVGEGPIGKREIARAFNITGSDRIPLKRLLKEMAEEGVLQKKEGRRLSKAGELPPVDVIEIIERDQDGELIAVPINWESEAAAPNIVVVPGSGKDRHKGPPVGVGDRAVARLAKTSSAGPDNYPYEARIIRRIGKEAETVLGIFREHPAGGRLTPVDKKARYEIDIPKVHVGKAKDGDLVLAETIAAPRHGLKRARIREVYGESGTQQSISLIAIHAHDIPNKFPERVLAAAEDAKPIRQGTREDFRHIPLITIDPADARDHDDAVWAAPDENPKNEGGWQVIVAIADVAAYVTPDSIMDKEARMRGNSTYFPDRVVPMLPEQISNNLCSLREGVDRPCLAVRMIFDSNGTKISHSFHRALMRSAAKLSYQQAQRAIDGHPDDVTAPILEEVLKPLWAAYQVMSKGRDNRSPLHLDLPEYKIRLNEQGGVADINIADRVETMRLIEECMIQANVCAAETLEAEKIPLIYRAHDAPSREKLFALGEFLQTMEMALPKGQNIRPSHFNVILDKAHDTEHSQLISDVVLRSQSQAIYSPDNLGHFGLNLRRYAHFTSPIRRYADLIVHRALIKALGQGSDGLTGEEVKTLAETAEHISQTERRSMLAERDSNDRYIASYLEKRVGGEFRGRIAGVSRFGLFVRLDETGADGIVPVSSLNNDYFHHDEAKHALIGERSGTMFRLGDRVLVRLEEATPVTGGLKFEILEGGTTVSKADRPKRGNDGANRGRSSSKHARARKKSAGGARTNGAKKGPFKGSKKPTRGKR
jgi:ribonuclease R